MKAPVGLWVFAVRFIEIAVGQMHRVFYRRKVGVGAYYVVEVDAMIHFRRKGFLCCARELMETMMILGMLSAVLFPILSRARESARRASCQQSLKELSLAVHSYQLKHGGVLPDIGTPRAIRALMGNTSPLRCPSHDAAYKVLAAKRRKIHKGGLGGGSRGVVMGGGVLVSGPEGPG